MQMLYSNQAGGRTLETELFIFPNGMPILWGEGQLCTQLKIITFLNTTRGGHFS